MRFPFKRLTELSAQDAAVGRHAAGRGLWLVRSSDGTAVWEICLTVRGQPVDLELGTYPELSVREARVEAAKLRGLARSGFDPSTEQEAFRDAAARNLDGFYQ